MQLRDFFPEMSPHVFDDDDSVMNFDMPRFTTFRFTSTPKAETKGDITSNQMPNADDTTAAKPKHKAAPQPNKKPKSKGRSGGDKSSNTIKILREQAGNDDIEAALKLGWGVNRITNIFNRNKIAKGEKVGLDDPIDDPELLARIDEKHKYQAEVQKKRQEKLRQRAYAGDLEAAKKIKLGKRKMDEIFANTKEEGDSSGAGYQTPGVEDRGQDRSPAQPFNFEKERSLVSKPPPPAPALGMNELVFRNLDFFENTCMPVNFDNDGGDWQAAPEPNPWYMLGQLPPPPRYPTVPPPDFDPERARRREYEAALQQVALAQANLKKAKEELEKVQAAKAANLAKSQGDTEKVQAAKAQIPNRKRKKAVVKSEKDETKSPIWSKKSKKSMPSNFPEEPAGDFPAGPMLTPNFGMGIY